MDPPADCTAGVIIDGTCVINPILCLLGYQQIANECVFVGCPLGQHLVDGACQDFGVVLPCPTGQHLEDGKCVEDLTVFLPQLCFVGQEFVEGKGCVEKCENGETRILGECVKLSNLGAITIPNLLP